MHGRSQVGCTLSTYVLQRLTFNVLVPCENLYRCLQLNKAQRLDGRCTSTFPAGLAALGMNIDRWLPRSIQSGGFPLVSRGPYKGFLHDMIR